MHEIEHQITYPGSNFIFHDSQGFEAGASEEMEIVWNFIEKRATETKLGSQLHAIWFFFTNHNHMHCQLINITQVLHPHGGFSPSSICRASVFQQRDREW